MFLPATWAKAKFATIGGGGLPPWWALAPEAGDRWTMTGAKAIAIETTRAKNNTIGQVGPRKPKATRPFGNARNKDRNALEIAIGHSNVTAMQAHEKRSWHCKHDSIEHSSLVCFVGHGAIPSEIFLDDALVFPSGNSSLLRGRHMRIGHGIASTTLSGIPRWNLCRSRPVGQWPKLLRNADRSQQCKHTTMQAQLYRALRGSVLRWPWRRPFGNHPRWCIGVPIVGRFLVER
jgi:hypothetical protein